MHYFLDCFTRAYYFSIMDTAMQRRLDGVLDRVKVLEDSIPLSHTEIIRMFRYDETFKKLTVYTDFSSFVSKCPSCLLISIDTQDRVLKDLQRALEMEFPGLNLVIEYP